MEEKLPPGWVRLNDRLTGEKVMLRASAIRAVIYFGDAASASSTVCYGRAKSKIQVFASPAEVARLIAGAEAAERRERALPVMAAILRAHGAGRDELHGECDLILDAIDARGESTDG